MYDMNDLIYVCTIDGVVFILFVEVDVISRYCQLLHA